MTYLLQKTAKYVLLQQLQSTSLWDSKTQVSQECNLMSTTKRYRKQLHH